MDDTKTKIINAKITLNEKVISEGGKEWQPAFMEQAIWAKIGEKELITSVKIEDVKDTTAATINELIGLLVMQENISEQGLQELVFNKWEYLTNEKHLVDPLDESVMQSLLSKC